MEVSTVKEDKQSRTYLYIAGLQAKMARQRS